MIQYYDRAAGKLTEEKEYGKEILEFLYQKPLGRLCLKTFAARPWFSRLRSKYQKSRKSRKDILPFSEKYGIPLTREELADYCCFNDFFTRPHGPLPKREAGTLTAPADAKLRYYPISEQLSITVKNSRYTIAELVEDEKLAQNFRGGTCLVYRLSTDQNHHYFYVDDGTVCSCKSIRGQLHTVRPIAQKYRIFSRNSRQVSVLNTEHLGTVVQLEVGALLVGKICNLPKSTFCSHEEKGFFEFGGSTIIILMNRAVRFDEDIAEMNKRHIETKVSAGEKVGILC